MGAHIDDGGEFQSDKYPTCPPGKVPLSTKDPTAQDLLWEYAQRRRKVDAEFSDDLESALRAKGYTGEGIGARIAQLTEERNTFTREIAEAAQRLGIYNGEVPLTGSQVLLLLKDMEEQARNGIALRKSIEALAESGEGYASARELRRALRESEEKP